MTFRRLILVLAFFTVLLTFSASAQAQRWNVWGTTPVFDGGRVMPLNTFSRQIVREICGTSRPFIVRDDSIIVQLNRILETQPQQQEEVDVEQYPYLISGTDIFAGPATSYSEERTDTQAERSETNPVISGINRQRAEQLIQRIKALVPQGGRYFDANELVLSWLGEPEIWDFIPIFHAPETDFRTEILDVPLQNDIRTTLDRISVYQLECSDRYQRRLVDIDRRRHQRGVTEVPIPYDHIAERIARAMMAYQEFTFHPRRHRPDRMLELLERSMDLSGTRESSFAFAFDAWRHLLSVGAGPELQAVDQRDAAADGRLTQFHPSTKRWIDISKRLQLLQRAFDRRDARGKPQPPNLRTVEQIFEMLLGMVDENFEESQALMERVYPGVEFRREPKKTDPEKLLPLLFTGTSLERNREPVTRIVLTYHYSIGTLRREIEAAYLALYDNGRSLRVMPIGSALTLGGPENTALGMQPWGSMQMLLYGGDDFIRRFFDPRFQLDTTTPTGESEGEIPEELRISRALVVEPTLPPNGNEGDVAAVDKEMTVPEEESPETEDEKQDRALEKALFSDDPMVGFDTRSRSSASQPALGPVGKVRSHFQTLVASYSTLVREYANSRFNSAAYDLQSALRETANRSEAIRLQSGNAEHPSTGEYLAKTVYPKEKAMNAEYRYYHLAPFFWMWVFAAGAVALAGISLLIGQWRRNTIDTAGLAPQQEPEKRDYIKSPEEYTLWIAIVLLSASIVVTFAGGVMRALISGWAPVTNMYETVVLMAFSASLFGLWYSLYPLIHPALQMAWRYTSFPAWQQIRIVLTPKPKAAAPEATDGEQAMRQAAEDFGLPGGMPIGMVPTANAEQEEKDLEAKKETKTIFWQSAFFIPRLVLMLATFVAVVYISYGEYAHEHGAFAAAAQMLKMSDFIDWLVVVASISLIVWFVPHLILTALLFPVLLARPSAVAADLGIVSFVEKDTNQVSSSRRSEMSSVFSGENVGLGGMVDVSGRRWLSFARNQILDRKLFVIIAAAVALLAGLAAHFNSGEFNPDIRPIVAVLRSNFWLTVHVIAIIVSYAAAMVAWGMAVVALGDVIFGRYRYSERSGGRTLIQLPPMSEMFAPIIHKLIQIALLLLIIGTVLGARWADYSWGRFWSWDPKEVWALITILFFAVVLHGRIARFYGRIGVVVGALFGSIAVIVTWYGINFVFKGSVHSYGGGASSNATIFMAAFILLNLLWGCLALFRYSAVMYGQDADE